VYRFAKRKCMNSFFCSTERMGLKFWNTLSSVLKVWAEFKS
jgi:hypothetical protein